MKEEMDAEKMINYEKGITGLSLYTDFNFLVYQHGKSN